MKNKHAAALGKLGAAARAKKLSAKERTAIARGAAQARWANKEKKNGGN